MSGDLYTNTDEDPARRGGYECQALMLTIGGVVGGDPRDQTVLYVDPKRGLYIKRKNVRRKLILGYWVRLGE